MTHNHEIMAANEDDTRRVAEDMARVTVAGDVLCLSGDLGAGKTTFTRYLTAALGSSAPVSSPTFTLIHEYPGGRLPVYHVDAYRLRGADDALSTGLEEYLSRADGVTVIEWPEKITTLLPDERLTIALTEAGDGRRIVFIPYGRRWEAAVAAWNAEEETVC